MGRAWAEFVGGGGVQKPEDERGTWEFWGDNKKGTPDWESLLFL